jgi:hypothetical protein
MGYRLINPYTIFIASFGCAILFYTLRWSEYYSPFQLPLIIFFIFLFGVCFYFARKVYRNYIPSVFILPSPTLHQIVGVTLFIYSLWVIEFIHGGGIPLFLILLGKPFNYRTFGVPSLHVFVVTFSSFYSAYLFHAYLVSRKRITLFFCLFNLFAALLIMNRGMLLTNLSTLFFIYLLTPVSIKNILTLRKAGLLLITITILFFLFGAMGTLRVSGEIKRMYDRSLIYEIGSATSSFKKSIIPSEFFWGYLYITSPLANLRHNISNARPEMSRENFFLLLNNEFLPDAISKRITKRFNLTRKQNHQIAENLNASTVFSGSFTYWGWGGIVLMFAFLMTLPFIIQFSGLFERQFLVTFLALINTLYLFLIFDNMISFTGFSFQLAYPVILTALSKIPKFNRN